MNLMWFFFKNYYKIILLSIIVAVIIIFVFNWYNQKQEQNNLFGLMETLDYSNVESVVVTKINQLWDDTKENLDSAEHWGKLGMNLYIHGYKPQSVPVYKKAASLDEKDFRWTYFCAIALDDLNSDETNEWFERGRQLNPNYPPLCVKLGNRYLVAGELSKATELFNESKAKWKNVPHAFVGLAKIAIALNELDTAQAHLNKALAMKPTFRDAHVLLADVYRRKGDKTNAETEVNLIEKLPEKLDLKDPFSNQMVEEGVSSFWCQVRGDNLNSSGRLDEAVLELKKVVEMKPHPSSHINLGNIYEKQKKYQLAINQYQLALELDSLYTPAMNNLAVVYFKIDDTKKAISLAKHSLEINPEAIDGYLNLGTFYKRLLQRSESIQYFKNGMALAPDDLRFAYQLSWLLSSSPEKYLRDGKKLFV